MHKTKYKRIALAVCFAILPLSANAAGLGKLTVSSGLGEPLQAEIDLVSTTPEELASLSAMIAPQEAYSMQGIERTAIQNTIRIEVVKKPDNQAMLRLTTVQPVSEPFLEMLVQVDWATGRLIREYTALLDPPGYHGAASDVAVSTPPPAPIVAPVTAPEPVAAAPVTEAASSGSAVETHTTRPGDTLHRLAKQMQVQGYSLDQMLVGLYRTNRQAFSGDNMNRLKVGQIIKAPTPDTLNAISPDEAQKQVRVQTADWNAYRNRLAGIVTESSAEAAGAGEQATSGKLKAAADDRATPREDGPRDVVKLSGSEADAKALQDKLTALQEESEARQGSLNEANERVAALEKQVADLQSLLAIKSKTMTELQGQQPAAPADAAPPVPAESTAADEVAPAGEVAPAAGEAAAPAPKPVKKPPLPAPEPVAEPGLLDSVMEAPAVPLGAGALLVLLAGGWLFLRNRRKRNLDSFEQGILTAGGLKASTVFGNTAGGTVDTGDTSFLTDFSQMAGGMIDTHDVDPIAEAEVYMAYGRDSQAEEILNDAIEKTPTRYELHLKLLEIFAARNDTSAFEAMAGELYSTLGSDDPVWAKVAEMGHKLEPGNPMYDLDRAHVAAPVEQTEAAPVVDATATVVTSAENLSKLDISDFAEAEVMTEANLDFSLDDEAPAAAAADDQGTDDDNALDFEFGTAADPASQQVADEMTEPLVADEPQGTEDNSVDFAMDFSAPQQTEVASDTGADTVAGMAFEAPADAGTGAPGALNPAAVFSETLPNLQLPDEASPVVANADDTLQLDVSTIAGETSGLELPATSDVAQAAETVSGFDLDFNLEQPADAAPVATEDQTEPAAGGLEFDLSGISLDFDDAASAEPATATEAGAVESATDEPEEVNTKLDLVTAYMDMGDAEGARELLEEVLKEGGARQRERAQALLSSLS